MIWFACNMISVPYWQTASVSFVSYHTCQSPALLNHHFFIYVFASTFLIPKIVALRILAKYQKNSPGLVFNTFPH